MTPGVTVVGTITRRLGFTENAWRERVLVIRGSLQDPEVIEVDVKAILRGEEPDVLIEPKDIVYVADRPWTKVKNLVDGVILSFIQSATSTWTNANVPYVVNEQWLPDTSWKRRRQGR